MGVGIAIAGGAFSLLGVWGLPGRAFGVIHRRRLSALLEAFSETGAFWRLIELFEN